jgi:hypothetical protein
MDCNEASNAATDTLTVEISKSDLTCCVCQEFMYKAKCLPCLHRICENCVYFVERCPLCRKTRFGYNSTQDDHFVSNITQKSIPFSLKCGKKRSFDKVDEHVNDCTECMRYYFKESRNTIIRMREKIDKIGQIILTLDDQEGDESEEESE